MAYNDFSVTLSHVVAMAHLVKLTVYLHGLATMSGENPLCCLYPSIWYFQVYLRGRVTGEEQDLLPADPLPKLARARSRRVQSQEPETASRSPHMDGGSLST